MSKEIQKNDLIEISVQSGLLQSLYYQEGWNLRDTDTDLIAIVADAVKTKKVQLFGERDEKFLKTLNGRAFFDLQIFLCDLIPHLEVSHLELMRLVTALVAQGGDDGMANQPNQAFRDWCSQDPRRSETVIEDAKRGNENAQNLICFALEAGSDAQTSIAMLSENYNAKILIGASTALSRMKMAKETAHDAVTKLLILACEHIDEIVRNNALVSVFSILAQHTGLDREYGRKALESASNEPTAETLHAISSILFRCGGSMTEEEVKIALNALVAADPAHKGTLSQIDMATSGLIKAGRYDLVSNFIKNFIVRTQSRKGLEPFPRFLSETIGNNDRLGPLLVDWFVDGDDYLCSSLSEPLTHGRDSSLQLSLKGTDLPKDPSDQIDLCRRAAGYLFHNPVTAASVIVSVLEHGDPSITDDLKDILFDPLLLCFGGELVEYLEGVCAKGAAQGTDALKEVLEQKAEMLKALQGVECLRELHPSESHRQLERVRWSRHMEVAVREGMKKSVLLSLVTTQTLLYGMKSSSYISDPNGPLRKVDMSMGEHSVVREYPQLDIFDPEGLQLRLLELKLGRRNRK